MLLHTQVYLVDKDESDLNLPHTLGNDEEVADAVIKVSCIEFAYPLDERHTQIATVNDRIKVNTPYEEVLKLMMLEDEG